MNNRLNRVSWLRIEQRWKKEVWYVPILALAMGLMMLRPLLMARLFNAPEFGTYIAGLLVSSSFCVLGCLGLQPKLQRSMPMGFVARKELASQILVFQAILVALLLALLGCLIGVADFSIAGLSPGNFAVSVVHGLSQQIFLLSTVESRSRGETLRFSWQNMGRAVSIVVIAGLVAWHMRSPGATLLTEAVVSLVIASLILAKSSTCHSIQFRALFLLALRRLAAIRWYEPLSLMLVMLVGFGLANADRWVAVTVLPPVQFAWYGFAWILLTAAQSIQTITNSSVYPALAKRFALGGRRASFSLASKASLVFLMLSGICAFPSYFLLEEIIVNWFADYRSSLEILPIFLVVASIRLSDFWSSHLLVSGKERLLLAVNCFSGVFVFILFSLLGYFQSPDKSGITELAHLALALTVVNYTLVLIFSLKLRR
ncbi:MAG: hypothetical protein CMG91_11445 [Marinobacter sp.]|nr:hypothetical protein [Marinobacter sp.]